MHKRWLRQHEAEIDLAEAFSFLDTDHDGLAHVNARTHARTHAHARTRAHKHTHTHTHTHPGLVSVEEVAEQMRTVMRVDIPEDEIRSICKLSLGKTPKGLTMEDFKHLVHWQPAAYARA